MKATNQEIEVVFESRLDLLISSLGAAGTPECQ